MRLSPAVVRVPAGAVVVGRAADGAAQLPVAVRLQDVCGHLDADAALLALGPLGRLLGHRTFGWSVHVEAVREHEPPRPPLPPGRHASTVGTRRPSLYRAAGRSGRRPPPRRTPCGHRPAWRRRLRPARHLPARPSHPNAPPPAPAAHEPPAPRQQPSLSHPPLPRRHEAHQQRTPREPTQLRPPAGPTAPRRPQPRTCTSGTWQPLTRGDPRSSVRRDRWPSAVVAEGPRLGRGGFTPPPGTRRQPGFVNRSLTTPV